MNSSAKTKKNRKEKYLLFKYGINEKIYKNNFIIFEISFIIFVLPVLVLTTLLLPIMFYFTIVQEFRIWPFIVIGTFIGFAQITAFQYFFKRFILKPYNMTFGEYLRFIFENHHKRKSEINEYKRDFYENLDGVIVKIRNSQQEETLRLYSTYYSDNNFLFDSNGN